MADSGADLALSTRGWIEASLVAASLTALQFALQWRYGFGLADEGWLWYLSQRSLAGELPILDWFAYDPGRYAWSAWWFRALGANGLFEQLVANAAFGAVGLTAAYACMWKARFPALARGLVAVLLALALAYPRHKTYEQSLSLLLMASCFLVLLKPGRRARWLLFGVATGLAAWFGRNSGVYYLVAAAACATVIGIQRPRDSLDWLGAAACFSAGVVAGYLPMLWLLMTTDGFAGAFVDSVKAVGQWQFPLPVPWPWRIDWTVSSTVNNLRSQAFGLLCVAVPFCYVLALCAWGRRTDANQSSASPIRQLAIAAAVAGVPYLHHAFDRADPPHIAQGIVPVIPLLGVFLCVGWENRRSFWHLACGSLAVVSMLLVVMAWLPSQPAVSHRLAAAPEVQLDIAGRRFWVNATTAQILRASRLAFDACGGGRGGFLIAPHYPGVYAYLGVAAPFWELYYLYPRSAQMQQAHIQALATERVGTILLNPEATIDGREDLKLGRTYPLLIRYIEQHYQLQSVTGVPAGFRVYRQPQWCLP